jgi:hypothetical protein
MLALSAAGFLRAAALGMPLIRMHPDDHLRPMINVMF